jgi:hypothetical protein
MFGYNLSPQARHKGPDAEDLAAHDSRLPFCPDVFNLGRFLAEDPARFRNPLIRARLSERERAIHLTTTGETEDFQQMLGRRKENEARSWSISSFHRELTSTGTLLLNPGVSCYPLYEYEGKLFLIVVGREQDGALTLPGGYYDHSLYRSETGKCDVTSLIRSSLGELVQEIIPFSSNLQVLSPRVRLPHGISHSALDWKRLARSGDTVLEEENATALVLKHPYPFLSGSVLNHGYSGGSVEKEDRCWGIELADFEPALPNLMSGYRVTIDGEPVPLLRVTLFAPWKSIQFILPVYVQLPSSSYRLVHGEDYLDTRHGELRTKLFLNQLRLLQLVDNFPGDREEAPFLPHLYESVASGVQRVGGQEAIPLLSESFLGDNILSRLFQAPGLAGNPTARDIKEGIPVSYRRYRVALTIRQMLGGTLSWRHPHSIGKHVPRSSEQ